MDLINKIIELKIEESERTDLLKIAQNYEKKSGFFSNIFGFFLILLIALAGFWFAKFHQSSYSIEPLKSKIIFTEKTWWGLFEDDQEFVCSDNKIVQKK